MQSGVGRALFCIGVVLWGIWQAKVASASGPISRCEEHSKVVGQLRVSETWLGNTHCAITVLPEVAGFDFREYLFQDNGLFTVYVSTNGPERESTGYRNYFLFPRRRLVGFEVSSTGKTLTVHTSNGSNVLFNSAHSKIAQFSGAQIKEDPAVNLNNYGGVEFVKFEGILLDTGWAIYEPSYANSERSSLFRDPDNHYCVAKNSDLFDYSSGDARFRFATDSELSSYLAKKCPQLNLVSMSSYLVRRPSR